MRKFTPYVTLILAIVIIITMNFKQGNYKDDFKDQYNIYAIPLPEEASFANEPLPLNQRHVKEALDRELHINTYWQSQTLLFIKLANKYFPVIEPILKEYNIPDDFKYLALIESGLRNIVSPAGAEGYWQLLEGTAKDYGLEVNDVVDERYHLKKSTEAACKYFQESYTTYQNWTLVAASYNMGRNGLNRQIKKQDEHDYYKLIFGSETGRYIYRLIAIKIILENPSEYGFHYRPKDLYPPVEVKYTKIDTAIPSIPDFNKIHGISYKTLKYYNPWLRENYLHKTNGKTYHIALPKK